MPDTRTDQRCADCRFFVSLPSPSSTTDKETGLCFFDPPSVILVTNIDTKSNEEFTNFVSRRPYVKGWEFCHNYRLRTTENERE